VQYYDEDGAAGPMPALAGTTGDTGTVNAGDAVKPAPRPRA